MFADSATLQGIRGGGRNWRGLQAPAARLYEDRMRRGRRSQLLQLLVVVVEVEVVVGKVKAKHT